MSDWTEGYVAEIGYTHGYYGELNPMRIKLAFLNAGIAFPEVGTACELGFGQGVSANIHAAASITQWSGTDFNPAQASFAQDLARTSGAGARLFDQAFDEFAARADLPDFDFICLHGIWSWISDANRAVIVDFMRRKLKVGGVVYISYNTLPGWAAFAPMRHLMTEHAQVLGTKGKGITSRVDEALAFAEKLMATQPLFAKVNTSVASRLEGMKGLNRHYLAHEYFNRDWHPMYFATMNEWMGQAKLQYACSANYFDSVESINLTPEQQALLNEIPDLEFRQSMRDFMVNQQFRKDYWVKGRRSMSKLAQQELLNEQLILLVSHRPDIKLKVQGALGEADLFDGVYTPILDQLSDHQCTSIAQLAQSVSAKGITFAQVIQAVMVLVGAGHVVPVQPQDKALQAKAQADKLNAAFMNKARGDSEVAYLCSPVSAGGHVLNRFQQLFLLCAQKGGQSPSDWARYAWEVLNAQGQKIIKEGQTLATEQENVAELSRQAEEFKLKQMPIMKALQIV
ncbi:class I SAM-dependent methyltransferase [Limnohabitans sp. Rim11]|uniref:class I SAM-dependent methyltransferase n=1 Tax=Limnohabitans sp. Rim11 TaxID=1100719 RepID=UPI000A451B07|nr:class I SAM-dependent methyltransferase [Limnohabitans sp. Rim11]